MIISKFEMKKGHMFYHLGKLFHAVFDFLCVMKNKTKKQQKLGFVWIRNVTHETSVN